jgi:nucleoside-diphosphate-sugar epimerase
MSQRVLVTGAGGFIGHHLVRYLVERGMWVRGVDLKLPEFEPSKAHEFVRLDLRRWESCLAAVEGIDEVYHLAADMGGIGYITAKHAEIAHNDILINTHMLEASRLAGVRRFLFSSSACIYPAYRQDEAEVTPLREEDAYPAEPEEGYGWEKLFTEKLCSYYRQDYGLETRVARFHNVYGPLGTYEGGKEKAPAALSRKIAQAREVDEIEVWGDGEQTRSFMYVDDCVEGIFRLMRSDHHAPLNLGTDRLVTVNELVEIIAGIAGKRITPRHDLTKPQGVRGRNSDNTRLRNVLGWEPSISLEEGLARTYRWIAAQLEQATAPAPVALRTARPHVLAGAAPRADWGRAAGGG